MVSESARIEQEVLSGTRRQPDPARHQYAQHVSVREQGDVALHGARPSDHSINPPPTCSGISPPGHPSRKISQPGTSSWICLGVRPSYSP